MDAISKLLHEVETCYEDPEFLEDSKKFAEGSPLTPKDFYELCFRETSVKLRQAREDAKRIILECSFRERLKTKDLNFQLHSLIFYKRYYLVMKYEKLEDCIFFDCFLLDVLFTLWKIG